MDVILNDTVDNNYLRICRHQYEEDQMTRGISSEKAQLEYAICFVWSRQEADIKHGIALLDDLINKTADSDTRRDCLYHLAFVYTKIMEYVDAMKCTDAFLKIEPSNHQVAELQKYIKKRMNTGLCGMTLLGGATLAIVGLVGLGVAIAKK